MGIGNMFRTVVLLGLLTALMLWVGQLVGGAQGLTIAIIIAIAINFVSYWWSDKIVLAMYHAKEIKENDNPELYGIVREVAKDAKVSMPRVYIVPGAYSNAFATGRNPQHAAVAVTQGILNLLNKEELKGVIAHEMSHIRNRDTLIQTIAATIAGVISYVAFMARWGAIFGGFGGRDRDGGNLIELLVLAIITPLIATLIQLAISRGREYLADETAAKMIKNSNGLASALNKLQSDISKKPLRVSSKTETTAHLFIANPFKATGLTKLFSTHPPMEERIRKLHSIKF